MTVAVPRAASVAASDDRNHANPPLHPCHRFPTSAVAKLPLLDFSQEEVTYALTMGAVVSYSFLCGFFVATERCVNTTRHATLHVTPRHCWQRCCVSPPGTVGNVAACYRGGPDVACAVWLFPLVAQGSRRPPRAAAVRDRVGNPVPVRRVSAHWHHLHDRSAVPSRGCNDCKLCRVNIVLLASFL